jgi:cephalosporin hydroxylase
MLVPWAARSLRHAADQVTTLEEAITLAMEFDYLRIRISPTQIPSEILQLLKLLSSLSPRRLMEIGSAKGGTLFLFSRVAAPDALLVSLNLPHPAWQKRMLTSFSRQQQRIELVQGDSHDPATLAYVQGLLNGDPLDFLLIDGDHSYAGVKSDYEMYGSLVGPRGFIAFHDIIPNRQANYGVSQFWQEVKLMYPGSTSEFVAAEDQSSYGIGVLRK